MRAPLLAAILALTMSLPLAARDLVIAGIPTKPNRWIGSNGDPTGIDVEIFDAVMKRLGVAYRVEIVSAEARLEAMWKDDRPRVDMVFTYSRTPEREPYLLYADESHMDITWNFFVLRENAAKIVFRDYNDLKGLTIGVTKDLAYSDDFLAAIRTVPLNVDEITQNELQLDKLLNRRVDMVPLNTKATLFEAKQRGVLDRITYLPKPIKSKPYFNTFVRKSDYPGLTELKARYDNALRELKRDGTLGRIFARYGID